MTVLISGRETVLTFEGYAIRKDRASLNEATAYEVTLHGKVIVSYVSFASALDAVPFPKE